MSGFSPYGKTLFGQAYDPDKRRGGLFGKFTMPPFTVLDARQGAWQDRKRAWIALGIKSELGRGADLTDMNIAAEPQRRYKAGGLNGLGGAIGGKDRIARQANHAAPSGSALPSCDNRRRERGNGSGQPIKGTAARSLARCYGQDLMKGENRNFHTGPRPHSGSRNERPGREPGVKYEGGVASANGSGTSIFDPVLCELMYTWFCPRGGLVLDPFAGGSVRGIVAGMLGRRYWGIDLREEQIAANCAQKDTICPNVGIAWIAGDSSGVLRGSPKADFLFSCPPYGNLERYSDDPRDLSAMDEEGFKKQYRRIIRRPCERLKNNRFAAFVVGEYRRDGGALQGFVSQTIRAFVGAGLEYYNDAILITAIGSLPIRVGIQFDATRKMGRTHQYVLVFVKGDVREATKAIKEPLNETGKDSLLDGRIRRMDRELLVKKGR